MGCSPSILSSLSNNNNNRKDSGLYCSNNSENSNKIDAHNETTTALANQILVQSSQTKDLLEKVILIASDSIKKYILVMSALVIISG